MLAHRGLILLLPLVVAGCAATKTPPERPIVVEAEQKPFKVQAYTPPPDTPARAPDAARPTQSENGRYRLSVASARTTEIASQWVTRAESLGYRAEVESATLEDGTWYRVVLPGFQTRSDVLAAIPHVNSDFGVTDAWRLPNESTHRRPVSPPAPAVEADPDEAEEASGDDESGDY